jgi:adiponectin receptor
MQDNEHIVKGYRLNYTVWETFKSFFALHNETGNIWTHFLGFVLFIVLTVVTVRSRPLPLATVSENLVALENQLYEYAKSSWEGAKGMEQQLVHYGKSNLQDLLEGTSDGLWAAGRGAYEGAVEYGMSGYRGLELRVYKAAASLLDMDWPVKRWPIYVFTAGAMCCMLTSSVCHLLSCCEVHELTRRIWRFDYAGIAVLIVCSFYPPVYYAFLCRPAWKLFYLVVTTILGTATCGASLSNHFQGPQARHIRAALFAALGLFGIVPIVHGFLLNSGVPKVFTAMWLDIMMGILYLGGAYLYSCRWPERQFPGKFDMAFHSHQLFHVAVVVAALLHYRAVHLLAGWRDETGGCTLPLLANSSSILQNASRGNLL